MNSLSILYINLLSDINPLSEKNACFKSQHRATNKVSCYLKAILAESQ